MKLYVGADHRGFELKATVKTYLVKAGHEVIDCGDKQLNPTDDFPKFAGQVCSRVLADGESARGLLMCGSGQGICMAANRFKGIRAALGYSAKAARLSRNDDDSNVLCLPADEVDLDTAYKIIDTWLDTPFAEAGRYVRRIQEMDDLG